MLVKLKVLTPLLLCICILKKTVDMETGYARVILGLQIERYHVVSLPAAAGLFCSRCRFNGDIVAT